MSAKPNRFAVKIGDRVAELRDGALCFSHSKTAALRDMKQVVREWRNEGGTAPNVMPLCDAVDYPRDHSTYQLKHKHKAGGFLRVVDLEQFDNSDEAWRAYSEEMWSQ